VVLFWFIPGFVIPILLVCILEREIELHEDTSDRLI